MITFISYSIIICMIEYSSVILSIFFNKSFHMPGTKVLMYLYLPVGIGEGGGLA